MQYPPFKSAIHGPASNKIFKSRNGTNTVQHARQEGSQMILFKICHNRDRDDNGVACTIYLFQPYL